MELYLFELTAADFCLEIFPDVNRKDKHNPQLFSLHLPITEAKPRCTADSGERNPAIPHPFKTKLMHVNWNGFLLFRPFLDNSGTRKCSLLCFSRKWIKNVLSGIAIDLLDIKSENTALFMANTTKFVVLSTEVS